MVLAGLMGHARPAAPAPKPAFRMAPLIAAASPLRAGALASSSLHLVGLRLKAPANRIDIPKGAPFSVPVDLWLGDHQASPEEAGVLVPGGASLRGVLTGPGLSEPVLVSGNLGSGLSLPALTSEGDFTLSDIRLVSGGSTLLEAEPRTLSIHCLGDILISSVTSTPMTMQELRDAGLQLQPGDYEGKRFTMALAIGSKQVSLSVPVAVPVYNGLEDPQGGAEVGRLELLGFEDRMGLPDLSVVVADIKPEKDPFTLSRPTISHALRNHFKALIVIPGSIGYLKQFYKVNLVVFNALKEGSPFRITHLSTTLNLPPGGDGAVGSGDDPLAIAAREGENDAASKPVRGPGAGGAAGTGEPILKAGESGMATYFVKALKEGAHQLNFDIRGQFEGGGLSDPVPLIGHAQGKVLVRNPAFSLALVHPDIVRRGEEYTLEARLTNTSQEPANGVSVTLDRSRLGSVKLVEDLNQPVDTLKPGETTVFKFKLRALRNGEVRSSYLSMEQGTIGFQLSTGLGERNIRLNPDTLLLPQSLEGRKGLPLPLREAMLRVLGQAYSLASNKGALPPGVLPIAMRSITGQLAEELSEQGLFLGMGVDKARVWMRLWEMFTQHGDPGFDQLVRTTEAGRELRNALLEAWAWADPDHTLSERLGDMSRWNQAFGTVSAAVVEGGRSGLGLEWQDASGQRVLSGNLATGDLPYLPLSHSAWGGTEARQWISIPSKAPGSRLRVVNRGSESQVLRLAAVAPVAGRAPTENRYEFELGAGQSAAITFGGEREGAAALFASDGKPLLAIPASLTRDLQEEPFQVLAVHRYDIELNPSATPYGTHVMMLFNRPTMKVDLPSGKEGFDQAQALVQVEANAPWRKVMAVNPDSAETPPSPAALFMSSARVASFYLERPVGPYVNRRLTLSPSWTDSKGNRITGALSWSILCGDIPGGALVRGKVRKANGQGLKATLTYFYNARSQAGNVDLATGFEFLDEEIQSHYALVTNLDIEADGSYQLDFVPEPVSFAMGPMLLKGDTSEGAAWAQASVLGNGQLIEMDLVLEGKGSVEGYVLGATGAPVAEARLQVIQEQASNPMTRGTGGGAFSQSTLTDAQGHYRVDGLKTGVFSIRVLKDFFGAMASGAISRDGEVVQQNVVLESATGTLKARLLDTQGQVVLDQFIRLGISASFNGGGGSANAMVWPEQARPGADGWVTFSQVPAGDVGLMVPTLPMGTVLDWHGYLDPAASQEVTLKMLPPADRAYAHFQVLDSAGKAVQGVYLSEGSIGNPAFAITNEEGLAPKRPVPSGRPFRVYAYHPAWTGQTPSESVVIQAGEDRLIRTTLPPRGMIHGTVRYPDGSPVKGAYVAIPPVYNDMKKNRLAISNPDGSFLIPNVRVGAPFSLVAVGPELRTAMPPRTVQVAEGQDVAIDLTLPFVGKNQVSGVTYQPLEGAQKIPTMAQVWVDGLLPSIHASDLGNGDWGLLRRETTGARGSDAEGKFTFNGLPPGPYTLHANSETFPVEVKSSGEFTDPDRPSQTRDIFLSSSFAGELKGVITKRDGQTPVGPDVRVRLLGGSIGELIIFTTEGGRYRFPKVIPAGCYKLRVEDPASGDIAVASVELGKESSQVKNLRLWGKGKLTVKVQDSFGKTLPEGVVTLSHTRNGAFACPRVSILDADDLPPLSQKLKPEMEGLLVFEDLLEGSISVGLKNPTGLQGVASVSIPDGGGDAEVVVRLQPVGDVLGMLYRADGGPVTAGRVDAYQGGRWLGVSPTRMDGVGGRFRFQVLPTGPISLEAWDPDSRQLGKGVVNVVAGDTSEVSITTHDKGPVVITVTQEGQPVLGAAIRLSYRGGDALDFSTESNTDADGKATFHLPPGDYSATATDPQSLAQGSGSFSRAVDQGEIQTALTLQAVRSLWATVLPPPGAPAGFSVEGWSLRDSRMGRLVLLDAKGQGMLRDLPVGSRSLSLTDLRGRSRGDFSVNLSAEGGAVQVPPVPLQATAYGHVEALVVDAHGGPVSNVAVYGPGGTISSDASGLARFLGLKAGNLAFWAAGTSASVPLRLENETVSARLQLPPTASVHGTVRDALGRPMPYLLVSVGPLQTATDGAGSFRVSGLGLGAYTASALSSTGRRAAVQVTLNQVDQDAEVRLDFPPQGSLRGRVKDPLRATPLPVHVMVYLAGGGNPLSETYTDGLGAFEFASLPAGQALRVVGLLDDGRTCVFTQGFTLAPLEGASLELELAMPALVDVKGWTLDALGRKIPMTVLLQDERGFTLGRAVTTGDLFDPDHPTFFFRYLLAGRRYRLMGLQEMTSTAIAFLDFTPAGDKELEELTLQAQLRRALKLQARYPDGTPTPGPGRFVLSSSSILGGRWEGSLGADGSALVQELPEGPAQATLTGLPNQPLLGAAFVIPAQSTAFEATVPAMGLGSLSLKVQTASGRLLRGGTLTAQGTGSPRWTSQAQTDGSYRLDALWIGVPLRFQATGFGLVGDSPTLTLAQHGQQAELVYPAPDQGSLSGTVRDRHGAALPGALLSMGGKTTTTDGAGFYRFSNLPLGSYSLVVTLPGRADRALASAALGSDGQAFQLDIPLKSTGSVQVKVVRPDGTPVPGQSVSLRNTSPHSDGRTLVALSDAQGMATFTEVLEGELRASILINNVERAGTGILVAGETLAIQIQTKDVSTLSGRVRRASAAPWPSGSLVRVLGQSMPLEADGTLAGPFPSVDYTSEPVPILVLVAGQRELGVGQFFLAKNAATVLDLTAPAFGTLTGSLRDAHGALVAGATVSTSGTSVSTDAQGQYKLEGLTAGAYQLLATLPGRAERGLASGNIALDAEVRTYNLTLKGTGTVRVTTLAADGTPLADQTVRIQNQSDWADRSETSLQTDGQGVATFSNALEGSLFASATLLGRTYYQAGTLTQDGTLSLTLKVRDFTTFSGRIRRARPENPWPAGTRVSLGDLSFNLAPDGTLVLPTPNPQGSFENGAAWVSVNLPGALTLLVGSLNLVRNGETAVDLVAPGYGSLSGTVKQPNGTPAPGVQVRVDGTYLLTDALGAWALPMAITGSHGVVAQTLTAIASGTLQLQEDGGAAALDLVLLPNTVSLPVSLPLDRFGGYVYLYGDGRMAPSAGAASRAFVSVDGAPETVPTPPNGIAQWILPNRQLAYRAQVGALEITITRGAGPDAVAIKEEIRLRNPDAIPHRVLLRHAVPMNYLQGLPSGQAQPVLGGAARDLGAVSTNGTVLWGNGALAPASVDLSGLRWPELSLAPGEDITLALAYAPYQHMPYAGWGSPTYREAGASRLLDRILHGAPEWMDGSQATAWANWLPPEGPVAPPLGPWASTLNILLKDASGRPVRNQCGGTFLPRETLAPVASIWTGSPQARQPGDGGQLSLSIPGNVPLTLTRDLAATGLAEVLASEAASVAATVSDSHGNPVASVPVLFPTVAEDSTDAAGRTGLWLMSPGTYQLKATLPQSDNTLSVTGTLSLGAGQSQSLNLAFPALGSLRLNILDAQGLPLSGWCSAYLDSASGMRRSKNGNSGGVLAWASLLPGTYSLSVYDPRTGGTLAPQSVVVNADVETQTTLRLPGLGQVQVLVLNPQGNRVPRNQSVQVQGADGGSTAGLTDDSGTVILSGLAPGWAKVSCTNSANGLITSAQVLVVEGQMATLSLQLPGSGSLRVTVQTADGRPVQGRYLLVQVPGGSPRGAYTSASGVATLGPFPTQTALVLEDYFGSATDPFNPKLPSSSFTLTQDGEVRALSSTLPLGSLRVLVREAGTGTPLPNATLWYQSYWYARATSNGNGLATFLNVPLDWPFPLGGSLAGYQDATLDSVIVASSQPQGSLSLELIRPTQIGFKLSRANGTDAPAFAYGEYRNWFYHLVDPATGFDQQRGSSTPAYTWTALPAGTYAAEAFALVGTGQDGSIHTGWGSIWPWKAKAQVSLNGANPQPLLNLKLPPLASWTLHLKDADGSPLTLDRPLRLVQKASTEKGYQLEEVVFNAAQGGADLAMAEHFPEGTHAFAVVDDGFGQLATVDLVIGPEHDAQRVEQELRIPAPRLAALTLHVRDAQGRVLQQDHGLRLLLNASTYPGFSLDRFLTGPDTAFGLQLPEGTHAFSILDRAFGVMQTFELNVGPGDIGNTLERTFNLPYVHGTWTLSALAGDGMTPALGAELAIHTPDDSYWAYLDLGTPLSLEVPMDRPLQALASFRPLGDTQPWVDVEGASHTLVEGDNIQETLQLPLTVARFRLLDQDGLTPMDDMAANLILPGQDARSFPLPIWMDEEGDSHLLLLGQPEASSQDLVIFDARSGLGQALQVQIPALGLPQDQDAQMPAYAFLNVQFTSKEGFLQRDFEAGLPASTPGLVAPWLAQGSSIGKTELGPLRVPLSLSTLWGRYAYYDESGRDHRFGELALSGLVQGETRPVTIPETRDQESFELWFYEAGEERPLDSALFSPQPYTLSMGGAFPVGWAEEGGWLEGGYGGTHWVPSGLPFTLHARIPNYGGRSLEGSVTDQVEAGTWGKEVRLILNPVPPAKAIQARPSQARKIQSGPSQAKPVQGQGSASAEGATDQVYPVPLAGSAKRLLLHLKKKLPVPPPKPPRP